MTTQRGKDYWEIPDPQYKLAPEDQFSIEAQRSGEPVETREIIGRSIIEDKFLLDYKVTAAIVKGEGEFFMRVMSIHPPEAIEYVPADEIDEAMWCGFSNGELIQFTDDHEMDRRHGQ